MKTSFRGSSRFLLCVPLLAAVYGSSPLHLLRGAVRIPPHVPAPVVQPTPAMTSTGTCVLGLTPVGAAVPGVGITTVVVTGTLAYAGAGALVPNNQFVVVDVATPAQPRVKSQIGLPGQPQQVQVVGHFVYVATDINFQIVDVSNPDQPVLRGSYNTAGTAYTIEVVGTIAYVSTLNGLLILDVSNPDQPSLISTYIAVLALEVVGTLAYVVPSYVGEFQIVDMSKPQAPVKVGSYPLSDGPLEIAVSGTRAYILSEHYVPKGAPLYSLLTLDVSTPTQPTLLSTYAGITNYPFTMEVAGMRVYIGTVDDQLQIVDTSNAVLPVLCGSYPIVASDLEVVGDLVYVASDTLQILRVIPLTQETWLPVIQK